MEDKYIYRPYLSYWTGLNVNQNMHLMIISNRRISVLLKNINFIAFALLNVFRSWEQTFKTEMIKDAFKSEQS